MIGRAEPETFIRWHSTPTALLLAGIVTVASAQEDPDVEAQYFPDEVPTCHVASASRTREACAPNSPTSVSTEREFTISLELAGPAMRQCEMAIHSEYVQRDTIVRVEQVINNETCGASSGHYEIDALIADEAGETEALVFSESWQRDDDRPVAITADYPLGENVELIRLRTRGLSCTCAEGSPNER